MTETGTPQIFGIGELLWDLLPGGARLGGTVTNFAVFCARLANHVVLASSVGNDEYGGRARSILSQPNLDLQQLQFDADHPTGTVEVTFSAESQPRYVIHRGVAWDFIYPTPGLLAVAATANAVCYGTLAQRHEVSRSTIQSFVGHRSFLRARVRHQYPHARLHCGSASLVDRSRHYSQGQ